MLKGRTKCTVIYQGVEADFDDKAAVQNLLTPMFQEIHGGQKHMARNQYLFPELESTAIELAILVGRLEQGEDEKKEANADFKERIDLLKFQIKQAARTINEGVAGKGAMRVVQEKGQSTGAAVPGYAPEQDGEAAH